MYIIKITHIMSSFDCFSLKQIIYCTLRLEALVAVPIVWSGNGGRVLYVKSKEVKRRGIIGFGEKRRSLKQEGFLTKKIS